MLWLLIGYMFLFVYRPFEIWPVLGEIHLERVYMLFTMGVWAVAPGKRWVADWQHAGVAAFGTAIIACWVGSPYMEVGTIAVENWLKLAVFYVLLVTVIHSPRDVRTFCAAFLVVLFVYLLHSFREFLGGRATYRMGINRMVGVDTSMGDPNTFAATIVYSLPLLAAFWETTRSRLVKLAVLGYAGLAVVCLLLTGSRGGFMGMIVCVFVLACRSRRAWTYGAGLLLASPLVFMALPDSLQNRFETIINPSVGPANAIESGQTRLDGLYQGLSLLESNPLTGVGPGVWKVATGSAIESHSLYGQMMGEMGLLGMTAFGLMVTATFVNIHRLRRLEKAYGTCLPELAFGFALAKAVAIMFAMLFMQGAFGHNLFRYNWLWFGGLVAIVRAAAEVRVRTLRRATAAVPVRRALGRPLVAG